MSVLPAHTPTPRLPRALKITGGILTVLALSLWGVHALVGYTALQRMQAAEARLQASGETLDFLALQPKAVPAEANFFALEPLKDIALIIDDDETRGEPGARRKSIDSLRFKRVTNYEVRTGGVDHGIPWDANAMAEAYRKMHEAAGAVAPSSHAASPYQPSLPVTGNSGIPGRDLLDAMKAGEAMRSLLVAGLDRPYSFVTPAGSQRNSPSRLFGLSIAYGQAAQTLSQWLSLHAQAAVACGEWQVAEQDVRMILRLAEGVGSEPTVINSIIAISLIPMALEPAWSLLSSAGSAELPLDSLQRDLGRVDIGTIMLQGLRGEMAAYTNEADWMSKSGDSAGWGALIDSAKPAPDFRSKVAKFQWVALTRFNFPAVLTGNKAELIRTLMEYQLAPLKTGGLKALMEGQQRFEKDRASGLVGGSAFDVFALMAERGSGNMALKTLLTQVRRDQAGTACALERFHRRHLRYPSTLKELVPEFLSQIPTDIMDGKPMRYTLIEGGRYKLWSLGSDLDDDGGKVLPGPKDTPAAPATKLSGYPGDWVWSYEPLVPVKP